MKRTIILPVLYIEVWFLNLKGWGGTDGRDNVVPLIILSFRLKGRILPCSKVKQGKSNVNCTL